MVSYSMVDSVDYSTTKGELASGEYHKYNPGGM